MASQETYYNAVAFISDIHANLEALESVLQDIEKQNVNGIYCLGDSVGYGADPIACLQKLHTLQTSGKLLRTVGGNHDYGIAKKNLDMFNGAARLSNEWTAKVLEGTPELTMLEELVKDNLVQEVGRFQLVHSTLVPEPEKWEYLKTKNAPQNFVERKIVFVGHSHIPAVYSRDFSKKDWNPINLFGDDGFYFLPAVKPEPLPPGEAVSEYRLELPTPFPTMIVNVGSVGQARDSHASARYLLYLTSGYSDYMEYRQVGYDVEKAVGKLKSRGLECDKELAIRLVTGGRSAFEANTSPPPWFPFS